MNHFHRLYISLLAVLGLLVASCSDDSSVLSTNVSPAKVQSSMAVTMRLSQAAVDSFAQAGINEVRVFAYIKQGRRDSLIRDTTVNIGSGEFQVGMPLGENISTYIVANAQGIENYSRLDSATLTLDPTRDANIWISNIVSFSSDKTRSNLDFTMRRIVSRATFQPEEDIETIASLNKFDNIDVVFLNIGTRYRVYGDSVITQTSAALNANAANSYAVTVNSFPTRSGVDANAKLALTFNNGNTAVNRTPADIDAGFTYEASRHYYIKVPLTDPAFLENAWTRAGKYLLPFKLFNTSF